MKPDKNRLTCPVCDSKKTTNIGQYNNYKILVCNNCGLRFSDPMQEPKPSFYAKTYFYKHRTSSNVEESGLKEETILNNWRFKHTLADMLEKSKSPKSAKVLDIGCGEGSFLYAAAKKGFQVSGIDIDPRAIETAKRRFKLNDVRLANFSELSQKQQFNFITLFETLEHSQDPKGLIKKIATIIEKNGNVYVSVPSFERQPKLFDPEADFPPHHLTLWTKKALEILFAQASFKKVVISERALSGEDLQVHLIWRIKRLFGKKMVDYLEPEEKSGQGKQNFKRTLGSVSLLVFELVAAVLKLFSISRGFTYMITATKAEK